QRRPGGGRGDGRRGPGPAGHRPRRSPGGHLDRQGRTVVRLGAGRGGRARRRAMEVARMILQPLLPLPVLAVVLGALFALTATLAVKGWRQGTTTGHQQAWAWLRRSAIVAVVAVIGLGP